jgi:hypothetical protein
MRIPLISRRLRMAGGLMMIAVLVSACATQPTIPSPDAPGFWAGMMHGFGILVSLLGSLLIDIRIYAFPNDGFAYDLGFFIGASVFIGGGIVTAGIA